jgi:poly(3-hydroxybutyrate) depolymerase
LFAVALCNISVAQGVKELERWVEQNPASLELADEPFADKSLSAKDAQAVSSILESQWRSQMQQRHKEALEKETFKRGRLQMKFKAITYGEKPADGRSLYISMHGGGATHKRVNDQQWDNQIRLYKPEEGVYVAPRAPWDDWNMWFKPGMDEFFEMLIQAAVASLDVNPDKVYLMGYSAGGDGVWRMAPRMADRWAAASMMAGHPGEASQVNLRNTPYMIWMGENDHYYNRNTLAKEKALVMDSLSAAHPGKYIHSSHILKDKGHWMEQADTAALSWMAQYRRIPYPKQIVWRQELVTREHFYWLTAPGNEVEQGKTVIANIDGNNINIEHCDYSKLTIYLNDRLANLDKKVTVRYKGKKIARIKPRRTIANLHRSLNLRNDRSYAFPCIIDVKIK